MGIEKKLGNEESIEEKEKQNDNNSGTERVQER